MSEQALKFTAIRLTQPIGELFVGKISSDKLASLAKADIRRITSRELEKMSGIQRGLSSARVTDIARYIETVDASFPNSFILNLNSEFLNDAPREIGNDCEDGTGIYCFDVSANEKAFSIIDGQHRLSGFQKAEVETFDLIVAFFIDLPIEDQAYLFSTINVTQQKVNKSLVYDLFDVSETLSPQRTAHLITKALNADEESPLYRRIKLLGVAPKFGDEVLYKAPLSQGAVASRIAELISADPMSDRDSIRRGKEIAVGAADVERGLIFRKFFAEEKDWAILRIMKNYFRAVADAFPDLWEKQDNPLSKTIGYGALMRLLVDAFGEGARRGDLSFDFFSELMTRVRRNSAMDQDAPLTFESFAAAGSGESKLYGKFKEWSELA
jgi:DGQHR domain-containing protein